MRMALHMACKAKCMDEVPVGAVVVEGDRVVGRGATQQLSTVDPSAHAEVVALRDAAKTIGNHRLVETTLYVTLEPCMMCTGLLVQARIARLIYGAKAPKTGVIESNGTLLDWPSHNHKVEVVSGVLEDECSTMLSSFFASRRNRGD